MLSLLIGVVAAILAIGALTSLIDWIDRKKRRPTLWKSTKHHQ
jgi:hypothetical protein